MIKKISIIIGMLMSITLVFAVSFNPFGDIEGSNLYSIKDFIDINATNFYQNGSRLIDNSDLSDLGNVTIDTLTLTNPPPECPTGYRSIGFNGTSNICALTIEPDGSVAFSGDVDFGGKDLGNVNNIYLNQFDREFTSNSNLVTVTVCSSGCNYTLIQDAVNDIPLFVYNRYEILVSDGTYNEDVRVPYFIVVRNISDTTEPNRVYIRGNQATPTNVLVNSLFIDGADGYAVPLTITGFAFTRPNPYDNENVSISVNGGSGEVNFFNVSVYSTPAVLENGLVCYDARCILNGVNLGINNISGMGVIVKHGGFISEQKANPLPTTGITGDRGYEIQDGIILKSQDSDLTGNNGLVYTELGFMLDSKVGNTGNKVYGLDTFPDGITIENIGLDMTGENILDVDKFSMGTSATPQAKFLITTNGFIGSNDHLLSIDYNDSYTYPFIFRNSSADITLALQNNGKTDLTLSSNGNIKYVYNFDEFDSYKDSCMINKEVCNIVVRGDMYVTSSNGIPENKTLNILCEDNTVITLNSSIQSLKFLSMSNNSKLTVDNCDITSDQTLQVINNSETFGIYGLSTDSNFPVEVGMEIRNSKFHNIVTPIFIYGRGGISDDIIIENNEFFSLLDNNLTTAHGIVQFAVDNYDDTKQILIQNNVLKDNTRTEQKGIYVFAWEQTNRSSKNLLIQGNYLENLTSDAIYTHSYTGVKIMNNEIVGYGRLNTDHKVGIAYNQVQNGIVSGNTIRNGTGRAIRGDSNTHGMLIQNNNMQGGTQIDNTSKGSITRILNSSGMRYINNVFEARTYPAFYVGAIYNNSLDTVIRDNIFVGEFVEIIDTGINTTIYNNKGREGLEPLWTNKENLDMNGNNISVGKLETSEGVHLTGFGASKGITSLGSLSINAGSDLGGNEELLLASNGVTSIIINSSGNVNFNNRFVANIQKLGVGVTVPESPFHFKENTGTTGSTTGMTIEQDGSGDSVIHYELTGGTIWSSGIDNSDGDKYKIDNNVVMTTTPKFSLTTIGVLGLEPIATAPATCTIGDIYVDTSGAYCACGATNTWSNMIATGTCS